MWVGFWLALYIQTGTDPCFQLPFPFNLPCFLTLQVLLLVSFIDSSWIPRLTTTSVVHFDLSKLTVHNIVSRNWKQNAPGLTHNPRSDMAYLVKINAPVQICTTYLQCSLWYFIEDVIVHDPTLNITKCLMAVILCTRWHTQQHSVTSQVTLNFDSTTVAVSHLSYSILIIWS